MPVSFEPWLLVLHHLSVLAPCPLLPASCHVPQVLLVAPPAPCTVPYVLSNLPAPHCSLLVNCVGLVVVPVHDLIGEADGWREQMELGVGCWVPCVC